MSSNQTKTNILIESDIQVSYESFVNDKQEKIDYVKLVFLKEKEGVITGIKTTFSPKRYRELVTSLYNTLNPSTSK